MTIEDLLDNFDAAKIASLSDEELKEYLKDIVNLEPKPLPTPLVLVKEDEEEETEIKPGDIECPIKPSKKRNKAKLTTAEKMALLEKEIDEL